MAFVLHRECAGRGARQLLRNGGVAATLVLSRNAWIDAHQRVVLSCPADHCHSRLFSWSGDCAIAVLSRGMLDLLRSLARWRSFPAVSNLVDPVWRRADGDADRLAESQKSKDVPVRFDPLQLSVLSSPTYEFSSISVSVVRD